MQSSKVLSILFCVIIWQLLALVINSELFPSFVDIVKNLSEQILHKDLIFHLLITLKRVFISLCSFSFASRYVKSSFNPSLATFKKAPFNLLTLSL